MTPEEHLKAGDPDAALATLQEKVRSNPADAKLRIFLFQLLCVLGDWTRAINQLKVSAELDESATMMAKTYREAIICEVYREKVFAGGKSPLIFGEPEEWLALLIEAQKLLAQGKAGEAASLRDRAFDLAPAQSGRLNESPFDWVADADMRLGPVLEVIVNGRYFWLPFVQIHRIEAEAPADLRDAVWTAVTLTLGNGGEMPALIPTRYAGTTPDGSPATRLARATEWVDMGHDTFAGVGQRLLATDREESAIMDLRSLVMDEAVPVREDASGTDG